jgi:DNA repair protein RadC
MKISLWPHEDRPREKLINFGAKSLTDTELIAILFGAGTQRKNALDLARELLSKCGSLRDVQQALLSQFVSISGLGKAKYAILMAAFELGARGQVEMLQIGRKINTSHDVKEFLTNKLRNLPIEIFACLFLNNRNHVINFEELFRGSLNETSVYPREVVKRALSHNAAKVILVHNHPSGHPYPSQADKEMTETLKQALALIEVKVIDHIVVGNPEVFSFAEQGWM